MNYPDDCLQSTVKSWWKETTTKNLCMGRLAWAFVPQVVEVPMTLVVEDRQEDTSHGRALIRIEQLNTKKSRKPSKNPLAAMPHREGEHYVVYRGKVRPVVLLFPFPTLPKAIRTGGWFTTQTTIAAPFYGADQSGTRAGVEPEFLKRIRHCEYRQYMWDKLPFKNGKTDHSVLRLDHLLPIGLGNATLEYTEFCLTDDALAIMDEWMTWVRSGLLPDGGVIATAQALFAEL